MKNKLVAYKVPHRKTPWLVDGHPSAIKIWSDEKGRSVEICTITPRWDEDEANAQFIVKACNCHDDLLACCQILLQLHLDTGNPSAAGLEAVHQAEAAIGKAKGLT